MAPRVLVIEDEPAIADNVSYALTTEGFEVHCCSTGQEAQARLKGGGLDLIILDVGLPDCNGFELCKEIRKASAIPIIFLTARADEVDRVVGLEIGGDDYVVKPFSPRELAVRVKVILRRTAAAGSRGDEEGKGDGKEDAGASFTIDRQRMKIAYLGQPLELSRYEFKILELLIGRPGWVFTRNQLMDHVWAEPTASMDRTIDTHIKTLRAKLKEIDPGENPIQTHRGFGYSLRETR